MADAERERNAGSRTERFRDAVGLGNPDLLWGITAIGLGHIGSNVVARAAQMGVGAGGEDEFGLAQDIVAYDPDVVEAHNLASSFYRTEQVGMPKAEALYENVLWLTGTEIVAHNRPFAAPNVTTSAVIVGVDTIEERRRIFNVLKGKGFPQLLIDGRTGGNTIDIYAATAETLDEYEESLHQRSYQEGVCGERNVAYTVAGVVSVICGILAARSRGDSIPLRVLLDFKGWNAIVRKQ